MKKFINQSSTKNFQDILNKKPTFYLGIDPTASGIHIGHLLPILLGKELIKNGSKGILLIGGFTGTVGDPTGKNQERKYNNQADDFSKGILHDIQKIFGEEVIYVNNKEWLEDMTFKEYIQFAYKISVNKKINMDTFKNRIKNTEFLSMTEFTYPDLQMIDFYYLNKKYNCELQIGGQDQWGNISFGVSITQKLLNKPTYGLCTPLLCTKKGTKISKTDPFAPFLNNPKGVYQFLINETKENLDQFGNFFNVYNNNYKILIKDIFFSIYKLYGEKNIDILYKEISQSNPEYINIKSDTIFNLLKFNLSISTSDIKRLINQNALNINGELITDLNYIPQGKINVSLGKKNHFFWYV